MKERFSQQTHIPGENKDFLTFFTDQAATGTGSVALNNKINPSFPWNVNSLEPIEVDDFGRTRTANNDKSTAQATSAQGHIHKVNKCSNFKF